MRARGVDPTNAPEAAAKRSTSLSQRKREELAWTPDPNDTDWTEDRYRLDILPRLATVPLSRLEEVTGLSISACSRIRSGKLTPHRRHWPKLAAASD
jgi:predicted RNase H-like nuclease